jgi:16S rRNA (cytosine1402-N4)-methyltransferase
MPASAPSFALFSWSAFPWNGTMALRRPQVNRFWQRLFQVGVWPWFGTTESMEDPLPWGRGGSASRPGNSKSAEPPPPSGGRSLPFYHQPVLLQEVLDVLRPTPDKLFFDGTLGGGGHTEALLQHGARVVAMDQDDEALAHAGARLKPYEDRFCALRGNFRNFAAILDEAGVGRFDGMLIDIGVSSRHLDAPERGFSFAKDGPLDMRMDTSLPLTAADIVNTYPQEELERLLREYGEEPQARRIARAIVHDRTSRPFTSTLQLAGMIERVCPKHGRRHPATLTFQALRIETNQEIAALREFLQAAPHWLKPGGRLAVITFHSIEDRVVKQAFQAMSTPFLDRPEWPAPRPNPDCLTRLLTRKPLEASAAELAINPRARSARLRAVERLPS